MNAGRIHNRRSLVPTVAAALLALALLALPATSLAAGEEAQLRPAAANYMPQVVGSESEPKTFELVNVSLTVPLQVGEIFTNTANWKIAKNACPKVLGPKEENCTIDVSFTPQSPGGKLGKLVAEYGSGAEKGSTYSELIGEGVAPSPEAALTPAESNFGGQAIGSWSSPEEVELTNISATVPLEVNEIVLSSKEFTVVESTCAPVLAPKEACGLEVVFSPQSTGKKEALLTAEYAGGKVSSLLKGEGVFEEAIQIAPPRLNFGNHEVGSLETTPDIFKITNASNASAEPVTLGVIALSGSGKVDFSIVGGTCKAGLPLSAEGGSCTIEVAFQPISTGKKLASLTVTSSLNLVSGRLEGVGI